ncbi:thermonuclease family protein [Alkalilimnicola sp. S0819]|uniref:thermonuclease family protein n=1 Tax=Alkalilimnicola sp. S0819 TaxID=2613922 RepID=UPI001261A95F|nr:thermonuclease family protein [Alkalilimnicola sp. S0819]KAB7623958.1 nuclease [Alkalilimnicola sp. S0819]MPQ16559.1 nuclease [Alkalilimnicola sp. S0819]
MRQPFRHCLVLLLLLLLSAGQVTAADYRHGTVVALADGDTVTVLTAERQRLKVRLASIDTPERAQPYGSRARQALAELVFQEPVQVLVSDVDRYGRLVGRLYRARDGLDVNAEMVRRGAAWVYRRYNDDPSLLQLEQQARGARRGLWALPEAQRTPPWDWRAQRRRPRPPAANAPAGCGEKTWCREMSSCEEARFHLRQCGLSRLDGDGDGVPCEALCR